MVISFEVGNFAEYDLPSVEVFYDIAETGQEALCNAKEQPITFLSLILHGVLQSLNYCN
jgi:hypothetical protein